MVLRGDGSARSSAPARPTGTVRGETDEVGHRAVTDIVTPNDWQATVLRLFGLDHERLVYRHDGVEQRLTAGRPARIVDGILA